LGPTETAFTFTRGPRRPPRPASRYGPSGSCKTYTAVVTVLGDRVALIDTEHRGQQDPDRFTSTPCPGRVRA
jgi:hypothetical protein